MVGPRHPRVSGRTMTAAAQAIVRIGEGPRTPVSIALLLLFPITLVDAVGFLAPIAYLLRMSFNEATGGGGLRETFTGQSYVAFLTDPFYLGLVGNSVAMSLLITGLTLLASYPIALFIYRAPAHWKSVLTIVCISPLLVSAVVRTYGWMLILGDQGLINATLRGLGIVSQPLRLINNATGVVIGLTEILMPYMILALLAGFGRLDRSYEEAAQSLGGAAVHYLPLRNRALDLPWSSARVSALLRARHQLVHHPKATGRRPRVSARHGNLRPGDRYSELATCRYDVNHRANGVRIGARRLWSHCPRSR